MTKHLHGHQNTDITDIVNCVYKTVLKTNKQKRLFPDGDSKMLASMTEHSIYNVSCDVKQSIKKIKINRSARNLHKFIQLVFEVSRTVPLIIWLHKMRKHVLRTLKLQSVSFISLSPSLFENLELQLLAELSSVRGVVPRHCSSADESNVLRWKCGSQSVRQKPTRTTQIRKHYYKLTVVNRAKVRW